MSTPEEPIPQTCRCVAVIMERSAVGNRWLTERWEARGVVCDESPAGTPHRVIVQHDSAIQVLFPGCPIVLRRDEAEGYYLNVTSPQPRVFVLWRMHGDIAHPELLTVSYHEGARWMDSEEKVDGVPLPVELLGWVGEFVERHYRPEPPRAKRYASNKDKGRMGHF